jgi:hypothetical protein
MHQSQENCGRDRFPLWLIAMLLLNAPRAFASDTAGDPVLHVGPQSSCQAGADYVGGVDADGKTVVPADLGDRRVPVPGEVVMPLRNHKNGYVVLDGAKLAPLLKPKTCN